MSRSLDLFSSLRGGVSYNRSGRRAEIAAGRDETAPAPMWRYLPLAVLATGSVIVLPGALVATLAPSGGVLSSVACAALAMALSIVVASAEVALWARQPRSRDIVFADLMLWGWVRRCRTERRLAQARELYDSAKKAGPTVSIELLQRLSNLLEERDTYTHGHSRRVARHAGRIARAMRLSPTEIAKIRTAATVHDVGKLYTPRAILNNPGCLSDREFAIVKLHPGDGAEMLAGVGDAEIAAMVRHHHERMDGGGYPDGLAGSQIPIGARIIAVADTFDAITSSRAYRPAATHREALDILRREAGAQLDGAAVAAFLHHYSAQRPVALLSFAAAIPERIFAGLQAASSSLGVGAAGTTSILPAIGAAGLLTFSPGLHHGMLLDQGAHRRSTVASHRLTTPATPTTAATRTRQAGSIHPNTHARHGNHRAVPTSPRTTAPRRTSSGKHSTPTPLGSGSREPTAPTTTQPATPPPSTTTTSETPPPAVEAPALPELPVSLPVKVPSLPGVPLPGVK